MPFCRMGDGQQKIPLEPSPADRHVLGQPKRAKLLHIKSILANWGESYWMPVLMLWLQVDVLAAGLKCFTDWNVTGKLTQLRVNNTLIMMDFEYM